MLKLQLPAAGLDGLLKKPLKEGFTHKTRQSEWRAACAGINFSLESRTNVQ